jgi:hypothetical protein
VSAKAVERVRVWLSAEEYAGRLSQTSIADLRAVLALAERTEVYRSQVARLPEPQRSALVLLCEPTTSKAWRDAAKSVAPRPKRRRR